MRFVVPTSVKPQELVFPVGARTMPPGREVRRNKPVLYLPNWVTASRMDALPNRETGFAKPNAISVHPDVDDPDQLPTMIISGGTEHMEDLMEMGEKVLEEQRASKEERRVEKTAKVKAKLNQYADHLDRKITNHKRNHRTSPDPGHSLDTEKRFY